jgi:tetratricopeptide (TPR) repeat protein
MPSVAEAPVSPAAAQANRRALVLRVAIILLLTFAIYWPALRGGFVWDDLILVEKNQLAKGDLNLRTVWFNTDFPLTTAMFWVQWLLWGSNLAGYHVVNVLLHAASAVLVWRVLARLKIPGAWLAGALFAVHPVCVASVAWISELKNTLSLPFCLLSLWWYLAFEERDAGQRPGKQRCCYWLSLGAFALALLSKTSTVMLPVLLLICAWWQRGCITKGDLLKTAPHFGLALAFGLMTVWFQNHQVIGSETVQTENFWGRLAGSGMAVWFYLGKALLPLNLNMIYPRWEIDASSALSYVPLLLLCGVLAVCWRFRLAWGRHALFGLGGFAVTLFPVLGFFDMLFLMFSRVSDHLQYLPLVCVLALVAAGLQAMLPAKIFRFVAPALVLALCVLTVQRAKVFASDEKLWEDTIAKNPAAWNAHNNLGCIRAEQNKMDAAIQHFEASLKYNPRNAQAHVNLGKALAMQNKFIEVESHFQTALDLRPNNAEAHAFYGSALAARGKTGDALKHLREAVRLGPEVETRLQLAAMLRVNGKIREAIEQTRLALSAKPDMPEALSNLAWLLATASDDSVRNGAEAVRLAEQACRLTNFREARMLGALAAAYAEAGRFSDAVSTAQKAIELARAAGDVQFAGMNEQLLRLYQAGRPYHEVPRKRDALNR